MADLDAQLAELQAEFQRFANTDDWISLAVSRKGPPQIEIGELRHGMPDPHAEATADVRRAVDLERNRLFETYGLGPYVFPPSGARRATAAHVEALMRKTSVLLLRALDWLNPIHAAEAPEIRKREAERVGYGFVWWIWYSVDHFCPKNLMVNFPQIAANALLVLRDCLTNPPPHPTLQDAPSAPEASAGSVDAHAIMAQVAEAVGGGEAAKIMAIAQDTSKSANERMRLIYALDTRYLGKTSSQWHKLLPDVTASAIRQTPWWKKERKRLRGQD